MATFRETDEERGGLANIAGSRRSLELYKSLFNSNDLADWDVFADLEAGWNDYAAGKHKLMDLEGGRERYHGDAIGSFVSNLENGLIPPPETLLALCDALNRYLMCNGSMSLDEAFFGERHAKNTSYAMAKGTNALKMGAFDALLKIEKLKANPARQVELAEDFLADSSEDEIDPESFLRSLRRWRQASRKWSD